MLTGSGEAGESQFSEGEAVFFFSLIIQDLLLLQLRDKVLFPLLFLTGLFFLSVTSCRQEWQTPLEIALSHLAKTSVFGIVGGGKPV